MNRLDIVISDIMKARSCYAALPYHNFNHALDVMDEAWRLGCESASELDWGALNQASLWHDVVYVPAAHDNEELSARFAYARLAGRDVYGASEVSRLIRLTKDHRPEAHDVEGQLLCDADLAGFAKSWDVFSENNERIEQEFVEAGFAAQYRAGRIEFLRSMEERARSGTLFNFPIRCQERNEAACKNIGKALLNLEIHS